MFVKLSRWVWLTLGAIGGLLALFWVLRDFDLDRFQTVLSGANYFPLLLLSAFIVLEQIFRAIKWRQLLYAHRPIGLWRLFGAIMIGYFSNLLVPLGVSPLVRGWLIARLEALRVSTVLATIALDRIIDGVVFLIFAGIVILGFHFPDAEGTVRAGISWGALASFVIFALLIAGFAGFRYAVRQERAPLGFLSPWFPTRLSQPLANFLRSFLEGAVWPRQPWRQVVIIGASIAIKLIAVAHFVWVGLAFDVVLGPMEYVFLMVFLGFLIVLATSLRIVGSFTVGAIFALQGLGVDVETALAMAVIAQVVTHLTVVATGAAAFWMQGIKLSEVIGSRQSPARVQPVAVALKDKRTQQGIENA